MQFILLFGAWQSLNREYSWRRIRVVSFQCDLVKVAVTGDSLRHIVIHVNLKLVDRERERKKNDENLKRCSAFHVLPL